MIVSTYDVDVTLTVSGVERELTATVRYFHTPAVRGLRERGSGLQLEPDERENAEILSVNTEKGSILNLLSDKQLDAITEEILCVES